MILTAENIEKLQKEKREKQIVSPKREIANNFIESTILKSNITALKTLFFISYKLKNLDLSKAPNNKLLTIRLDKKELLNFTKVENSTVLKAIKKIQETSITFLDEEGKVQLGMSLFPRYEVLNNKNIIEVDIYIKVAKLIIDVKKNFNFTPINLKKLMEVKRVHTLRFLTLLTRISNYDEHVPKRTKLKLNELNAFFGTNYKTWSKVEIKLIKPIKQELDNLKHLSFIYESRFESMGRGRPKFDYVTIDVLNLDDKKRNKEEDWQF